MYKNARKEDLLQVIANIGEQVTDSPNIVQLKQIKEKSQAYLDDQDFVKELIASATKERKENLHIEKREKERIENLEVQKIQSERDTESQKFQLERVGQFIFK